MESYELISLFFVRAEEASVDAIYLFVYRHLIGAFALVSRNPGDVKLWYELKELFREDVSC